MPAIQRLYVTLRLKWFQKDGYKAKVATYVLDTCYKADKIALGLPPGIMPLKDHVYVFADFTQKGRACSRLVTGVSQEVGDDKRRLALPAGIGRIEVGESGAVVSGRRRLIAAGRDNDAGDRAVISIVHRGLHSIGEHGRTGECAEFAIESGSSAPELGQFLVDLWCVVPADFRGSWPVGAHVESAGGKPARRVHRRNRNPQRAVPPRRGCRPRN